MKFLIAVILLLVMSGCTTVETVWGKGKAVGGKVLSQETKEKLSPMVEKVEQVYGSVYEGKSAESQ